MSVFYEVATLSQPVDGRFYAVIRIDTDIRVDNGCEGTVASLHQTYPEADAAAARSRPAMPKEEEG